ncbi:MAG: SDR family oxidoreductase [Myxococcales bacterium]|nr:SDR family oxidoreductase [Myxococcales bacterium]
MSEPRGAALITGASSGIGTCFAHQLAARGWPLLITARRGDRLAKLAETLNDAYGVPVEVVALDLADPDAPAALFAATEATGRPVEILINNAGYGLQGRFVDQDMAAIEPMIRLNVLALTELTLRFARPMVAAGRGRILQVASAAAFLPSPYVAAYAASKHYVKAFAEAVRFELRNTGVTMTTLYPGITRTEFNTVAGARTPRLMNLSILSADTVARIGLRAMFRGRRAVVPGLINKLNAFFSEALHRGLITHAAGRLLEDANGHHDKVTD